MSNPVSISQSGHLRTKEDATIPSAASSAQKSKSRSEPKSTSATPSATGSAFATTLRSADDVWPWAAMFEQMLPSALSAEVGSRTYAE